MFRMLQDPELQALTIERRQHVWRQSSIGEHQSPTPQLFVLDLMHVIRHDPFFLVLRDISRRNHRSEPGARVLFSVRENVPRGTLGNVSDVACVGFYFFEVRGENLIAS